MFSNALTLNASTYRNVFSGSSGNLYVPVKPSAVIYSQFNYVHGTAASRGQSGVPVDKVRMLNTLIDQLVSMKTKTKTISKNDTTELTDDQKNALIKQYQSEIKNAIAQSQNTYGFAGLMPEPGTVFSISA